MRSQPTRFVLLALGTALGLALPALAHPGHGIGGGSESILHYLTEPLHVAPLALVALGGVWLGRRRAPRSRARSR